MVKDSPPKDMSAPMEEPQPEAPVLLRLRRPEKAEVPPPSNLSEPEQIRRGLASLINQDSAGFTSIQINFRSNQPTLAYTSRECCPEAAEYTADNLLQSGVPLWYALFLANKIAREMYPRLPLSPGHSLDESSDEEQPDADPTPPASPVRNNIAKRAHALLAMYVEEILHQSDEDLLREKPLSAFPVSIYAAKNQRRSMEDRHLIIPRLGLVDPGRPELAEDAVYAVFDGHGGAQVAGYLATHFLDHLIRAPAFATEPGEALAQAFTSCDRALTRRAQRTNYRGGSTAVVAHFRRRRLTLAWAGDSQGGLLRLPGPRPSLLLSDPLHSPSCPEEYERITEAGGSIVPMEGELRVQGCLNLTRSFGDISLKPDIVIVDPGIAEVELEEDDCILLLGCDGLWDHISVEDALETVHKFVLTHEPNEFPALGKSLGELAKAQDSSDNITAVVVALKPLSDIWPRFKDYQRD